MVSDRRRDTHCAVAFEPPTLMVLCGSVSYIPSPLTCDICVCMVTALACEGVVRACGAVPVLDACIVHAHAQAEGEAAGAKGHGEGDRQAEQAESGLIRD
jgi:hypothetical protein